MDVDEALKAINGRYALMLRECQSRELAVPCVLSDKL